MAVADYPAPVLNRSPAIVTGGTSAAPITASLPRVRVFPFHLACTSKRVNTVSQAFSGPAVIAEITWGVLTGGNDPVPNFNVYVSTDNSVPATVAAPGTPPSGTQIFDLVGLKTDGAVTAQAGAGVHFPNFGAVQTGQWIAPLRRPVLDPTFYLKVSMVTAASAVQLVGTIRVIEGLTAEDLPNFL